MNMNRLNHFANLQNCVTEIILTQAAIEALAESITDEQPGEAQILNVLARNLETISAPLEMHFDKILKREKELMESQVRRERYMNP